MGITNPESSAFDAVELEDSVLKASLPIKPPLTSSNLHGLVNFRHSQPGLQILTIRTTDCIHFLLPTVSSLLLFDNMPLHHENTLVCHGTLSACDCGGYHANSPGKKWYEKYTTLDNQKASSQSEALNCHYFSKNHSEALSCVSCASFHYWFMTGEAKSYISSICLDLLKSLLLLLEFLDLCFPFLSKLGSSTALGCLFRCFLSLSDLLLFSSNLFLLAFSLFCFAFLFSLSPFSISSFCFCSSLTCCFNCLMYSPKISLWKLSSSLVLLPAEVCSTQSDGAFTGGLSWMLAARTMTLVTEGCPPVSCTGKTEDLLWLSDNNLGHTPAGKQGACTSGACICSTWTCGPCTWGECTLGACTWGTWGKAWEGVAELKFIPIWP